MGFWFLTMMEERHDASFEGRICLWPVPRSLLPPVDVAPSAACVPSQLKHADLRCRDGGGWGIATCLWPGSVLHVEPIGFCGNKNTARFSQPVNG